jgi:2-oxoacid:acceptor oxidoreductase delta subunit (pyruvate/2-ketoisovalerate family)
MSDKKVKSIEVVGRGVEQTANASAVVEIVATAAIESDKAAMSYTRYGDAPDRVGIPIKTFTLVADSFDDLEELTLTWEPQEVEAIFLLDPTLIKGTEAWGHQGLRPTVEKLVEEGVVIINSDKTPKEFLKYLPKTNFHYYLATIDGNKIDLLYHVPLLGCFAKLKEGIVSLESLKKAVRARYKTDKAVDSLMRGTKEFKEIKVAKAAISERIEGFVRPKLAGYKEMSQYIAVAGPKPNTANPNFKGATSRSKRPVIDYDKCIKCSLCWIYCPDGAIYQENGDFYVNLDYCKGCGICATECNPRAITMIDELDFTTWGQI